MLVFFAKLFMKNSPAIMSIAGNSCSNSELLDDVGLQRGAIGQTETRQTWHPSHKHDPGTDNPTPQQVSALTVKRPNKVQTPQVNTPIRQTTQSLDTRLPRFAYPHARIDQSTPASNAANSKLLQQATRIHKLVNINPKSRLTGTDLSN